MLKTFGQIPVAEKELVSFSVPADQRLRLRAADGRPDSDDRAQRLFAVQILQLAVHGLSRRLDKLAHLECGRTSSRPMIRLVAQRAGSSPTDVSKTVQRGDLGSCISLLHKPSVDETAPERIGE